MTDSDDVKMSEGVDMKKSEGEDVKMSRLPVNRAIGGVSDDQSGEGLDANAAEVSPLETVGHLYAMDDTIKQMSFVTLYRSRHLFGRSSRKVDYHLSRTAQQQT